MSDATGLAEALLGLDGFRVLDVNEGSDELVVTIETSADVVGCGACGTRAEAHAALTPTSSVATTDPSSPPTPWGTGVASAAPAPPTSNPARPGGTPGSSPTPRGSRDELLAIEQFDTVFEAQVLVGDWRAEYNDYRPHSALGMLSPAAFSHQWRTNRQHQLS